MRERSGWREREGPSAIGGEGGNEVDGEGGKAVEQEGGGGI